MSAVGLPSTSASSATARSPDSAQHPDHWCRSRARSWPPRAPASSSAHMPTSRTSCPRTHTGPHVGFPGGIRTSRGFPSGQATEARRQAGRPPVAPHQSSDHTSRPISVCPRAQPCPPAPARHSRSKTKLRPPPLLTATCHIPGRAPDSRASPWPKPGSSSPPSPGPAHAAVRTRLSDVGAKPHLL